ncbi:hypothetical protein [Priestia endophytica]|uniref:hypothetical protein n=1 Tax=Priestia endophytica TaxID=135735 RepID=UPI00124BF844|nr:hypothetical protein [Priestia endophytica]KAB2489987.1 hypothetical protein F8155_21590 [Priestia endophytica]
MEELKEEFRKVREELKVQFSQLDQEMKGQFNFINKRLDRMEGPTNERKKSTESSIEDKKALIERFKKGTLTSDDILNIIDNLENGERLDLLNKLYDLHYNLNPYTPKGLEISWDD